MSGSRLRNALEWTTCVLAATVAVVALIIPAWIEVVFGADPDRGSGALEWLITALAFAAAISAGMLARWDDWRIRGARHRTVTAER